MVLRTCVVKGCKGDKENEALKVNLSNERTWYGIQTILA